MMPEIEAILAGVGRAVEEIQKRRAGAKPDPELFSALEKNPFGTLLVDAPEPIEIAALVREVPIVRHAERHRDVGGLVALELVARAGHVDRDRSRQGDDEQDGSRERRGAMGRDTAERHG
jgi:hypothetical protein